jgi:hypothetical protein
LSFVAELYAREQAFRFHITVFDESGGSIAREMKKESKHPNRPAIKKSHERERHVYITNEQLSSTILLRCGRLDIFRVFTQIGVGNGLKVSCYG